MFRDRPALAAELLDGRLDADLPAFDEAQLSSADLTDIASTEYRADAVVTLKTRASPVLAVVVEIQLDRDRQKRHSWPAYVATLHARVHCPVALLVMCPTRAVAKWSAQPVPIGPPGSVVTPIAVGPDQIPVITDSSTARQMPELAVLSALAHGGGPEPTRVFEALLDGLYGVDQEHAALYTDLIFSRLPAAARKCLEDLMTVTGYRYQSDFALRYVREGEAIGEARGEARGEANAVLAILDTRGVVVPDDVRAVIAECADLERLGTWIRQAVTADKIEDLGISTAR
jgi:hypothetical protein